MKVLIVDDNDSIRAMIRSVLSPAIDNFYECSDGADALESYSQFRPDWVLMDIKMKQLDGFQATEEIRRSFPNAKIIMITQYNDPKLEQKARKLGVVDFVLKEHIFDIQRIIMREVN